MKCFSKVQSFSLLACLFISASIFAQPVLETGGKEMPESWIDNVTGHVIKKLVNRAGNNRSFYFHNNPFVDGKMIFYGSDFKKTTMDGIGNIAISHSNKNPYDNQLYSYDFSTNHVEKLTNEASSMNGEIVSRVNKAAYFQIKDTVFSVNIHTKKIQQVFIFPADFVGSITTVNADGTLLGGSFATDAEKEIFKNNPQKHDYFNKIYESKLPRTLFTINIKTGILDKIFTDSAWLNHVQFSPTDPTCLMFCHEGPWQKVDRIWTINVQTKQVPQLIHKRTMDMEIAGHEWFSSDGKYIWYDLQMPRGKNFFVGGTDLSAHTEKKYKLQRNEWSVHYVSSWDQKTFAGDGGATVSVANAPDGKWIYLFKPEGDHFVAEKLVNMKNHNYALEPNVHYSPNGQWIIFRANFEGHPDIYAVRIAK